MAKIPLEQISVRISSAEKQELQRLADEKGKSFSEVTRIAIQAYLFALRSRERKIKMNSKSLTNDIK
jgi:predicted transcriptional regulator